MRSVNITKSIGHNLPIMKSIQGGLVDHASALSITSAEVATLDADVAITEYIANFTLRLADRKMAYSAYASTMMNSDHAGTPPLPVFDSFNLPESGVAGVFPRLRRLVKKIKSSANYTLQIAEDLGLVILSPVPEPAPMFKPVVTASALVDDEISVKFKKGRFSGAELQWRLQGQSQWTSSGNFYSSPIKIKSPIDDGAAGVVELRIRMVKGNLPVTNYSQIERVVTNGE